MNAASTTHLVLIPSYNPGALVYATVQGARAQWKKLKGEGHSLTYWQQTSEGRWEKKA